MRIACPLCTFANLWTPDMLCGCCVHALVIRVPQRALAEEQPQRREKNEGPPATLHRPMDLQLADSHHTGQSEISIGHVGVRTSSVGSCSSFRDELLLHWQQSMLPGKRERSERRGSKRVERAFVTWDMQIRMDRCCLRRITACQSRAHISKHQRTTQATRLGWWEACKVIFS